MTRRVLMISPHFPPDSTAGTHRVRLLAPYLERFGWEPTVLTLDASSYEGSLDPDLPALIAGPIRVVRVHAMSARLTRCFGVGDLGIRSFAPLYGAASRLLESERFDALFITIFPAYTALLGPLLVRRFGVPFVLDYQDPWVSAWGVDVGGGKDGRPDLKSRLSRFLAERLEPRVVRVASAVTAVSAGTYEPILARNPGIAPITATIPIGGEPGDFLADPGRSNQPFDPSDGCVHICSTGTILPLGFGTLSAVLRAAALVRDRRPDVYRRLRFHFYGTSNQSAGTGEKRVVPLAERLGVSDVVEEVPNRIPYSQAVGVQREADALLAMGSTETHYTASKIFPMLLARRPLLAVYHEQSSVTEILAKTARPPSVRLVTYSEREPADDRVELIAAHLIALVESPVWRSDDVDMSALAEFFAESLAGRLAGVFDRVVARRAAA